MASTASTTTRRQDAGTFSGHDAARRARMHSSLTEERTFLWQVWPGRNWPATARDEREFVDSLTEIVGKTKSAGKKRSDRGDITAVMNALRCGLGAEELFERAPGLKPVRILQAYREVESMLNRSYSSWEAITAKPTLETIVKHRAAAQLIASVPVSHLLPGAVVTPDKDFAEKLKAVTIKVEAARKRADSIENALDRAVAPSSEAIRLGAELYNPYDPTVWGGQYFIPVRVGELMPLRLASLLGERNP